MWLRVVRGLNETANDQTVAYWPPAHHPEGAVRGESDLGKGLYKLIITPEGLSRSFYLFRVQQVEYAKIACKAVGPLPLLLLLAVILPELSKSKRFRKWWVSVQS